MKKFKLLMLICIIAVAVLGFSFAYADSEVFVADLYHDCMSAENEAELNKLAKEIYEKYNYAVYYIVTANTGKDTSEKYAEDYFLEHTPCVDGFVFLDNCGADFGRHYYSAASANVTLKPDWDNIDKAYLGEETFYEGAVAVYKKIASSLESIQSDELHRITEIENKASHLLDDAGVLSEEEEAALLAKLDEVSSARGFETFIIAEDTLGGRMPLAYAKKVFNTYTLGATEEKSGFMLLFAKDTEDFWLLTLGGGAGAFTDAGIEYISNEIHPGIKSGNYNEAFNRFADLCGTFLEQSQTGTAFDENNMLEPTVTPLPEIDEVQNKVIDLGINFWVIIAVALGIAVIIFIIVNIRKQSFYVYDEEEERNRTRGRHDASNIHHSEADDEEEQSEEDLIDF